MRDAGAAMLGRPYDLQFRWDDERLYCSELVHKVYAAGGVELGEKRRAGDFDLSSPAVRAAMRERFGGAKGAFDPEEPVVSPQSIFDDAELMTVYER